MSTFVSKYCLQNPFYELVYESAHPALLARIVCWKNTYTFMRMLNARCISKPFKMEACCIGKFPFSLFDLVEGPKAFFALLSSLNPGGEFEGTTTLIWLQLPGNYHKISFRFRFSGVNLACKIFSLYHSSILLRL